MVNHPPTQLVEVTFSCTPPTRLIERASGVSDVEVTDHTIRCLVYGSFQPFLEAVRGYEVISLTVIQAEAATEAPREVVDG